MSHGETFAATGFHRAARYLGYMEKQPTQFPDRAALVAHVKALSPGVTDDAVSETRGGRAAAEALLAAIDPTAYGHNRNYLDGAVTRLSPYIRHAIVSLNELRNQALEMGDVKAIEKFIQELGWRDFWQRIYTQNPDWLWHDIEPYKTGFVASDYADTLPQDIAAGETDSAAMNHFIQELKTSGYLHNHARMYLAAYIVHWRRVKWQAGARFFLGHLLDGDPASNNFSFQWVASTFANKPYFFNLENLQKFAGMQAPCDFHTNKCFGGSYDDLALTLFPHMAAL
jgi:deoxyribodipyrimidine photo-lyase